MHYSLKGFSQIGTVRSFWFERIETGVPPVPIAVKADIVLARKHHFSLQDLPALCVQMLEAQGESCPAGVMLLNETVISRYAAVQAAEAAKESAARSMRSKKAALALASQQKARAISDSPPFVQ